ncbi:hypothetical protein RS130_19320 [Paraglaciecola aquimarina]|uniref:Orphan protein n=1 Tax=Paraglaciecola aquimarina TaxID=1235557 RepID=A0ABU3T0F1_9ALTE|nr:hypothetical protein [Paraglaciecola aquimarina]MDU0355743.1 hypothetical protein [Paraglaciecola aquimarina]
MKKLYYYRLIATLTLNIFIFNGAYAAEPADKSSKENLIAATKTFMSDKLNNGQMHETTVEVMPIDDRIVIPRCGSEFEFSVKEESLGQSNIAVKAECQTNNWYMFVIVKAIEIQPVVVLTNAVSPGDLID